MARAPSPPKYSIAAVSKLTGVSCHALRVWERRYGYPKPNRSGTNQRRYGTDQVNALRELAELARSGHPIGELIADFLGGRLKLDPHDEDRPRPEASSSTPALSAPPGLIDALFGGDLAAAEGMLARLAEQSPPFEFLGRVLEPAIVEVGERWFGGTGEVFQEHFATGVLFRAVSRLLDEARRSNAQPKYRALVASVQGDRHEGGVLILSVALELSGWRALSLGVDLPVVELLKAVESWRPDAVGVSFVLSRSINKRFLELAAIRDVPVFVGGRSLMNHKGLARRHGLRPLAGPIGTALPQWHAEFARWQRGEGSRTEPGS